MSVIFLLIPLSILIATGFLLAFLWAVTSGQYEDTNTPSLRVLLDEPSIKPITGPSPKSHPKTFTDGKIQKP
jgi:cbb3-type cytochrome oxidase maturation protein